MLHKDRKLIREHRLVVINTRTKLPSPELATPTAGNAAGADPTEWDSHSGTCFEGLKDVDHGFAPRGYVLIDPITQS